MRPKSVLILFAIVVALLAFIWFYERELPSSDERGDLAKKTLRFELRTGTYDKTKPYRLVLRDAESDAEVQAVPVVIDRSFDDDF